MERTLTLGRMALAVVVGVLVGVVGGNLGWSLSKPRPTSKTVQWEYLEAEDGTDLQRLEIPTGWIVEGADGYLVVVPDAEKTWLSDPEAD